MLAHSARGGGGRARPHSRIPSRTRAPAGQGARSRGPFHCTSRSITFVTTLLPSVLDVPSRTGRRKTYLTFAFVSIPSRSGVPQQTHYGYSDHGGPPSRRDERVGGWVGGSDGRSGDTQSPILGSRPAVRRTSTCTRPATPPPAAARRRAVVRVHTLRDPTFRPTLAAHAEKGRGGRHARAKPAQTADVHSAQAQVRYALTRTCTDTVAGRHDVHIAHGRRHAQTPTVSVSVT